MKISATKYQYEKSTSFKSTFPVAYWIRESNGSYAPVATREIVEPLHRQFIEALNNILLTKKSVKQLRLDVKDKKASERTLNRKLREVMDVAMQRFRAYISSCDPDYRYASGKERVRAFYNNTTGELENPYVVSYIITGGHVSDFNKKFAKPLGKQKKLNNEIKTRKYMQLREEYMKEIESGKNDNELKEKYADETQKIKKYETSELKDARWKFNYKGLEYVKDYIKRIKDKDKKLQVLHAKFEIQRDAEGNFIDYQFVDARFLPEFGPDSPFEKLKRYIV